MVKRGKYDYPELIGDYNLINIQIRKDIVDFCKKKGINKSKLIEEFYKTILIRFRDGSLNASSGYVTLNIFRKPIIK